MPAKPGQIRIIGGQFRGRKLPVLDIEGLRPTPDRVRETLFNWLMTSIHGAHCLDLFAGTGILGFEALSRGAASVTMVDKSPQVVAHLQQSAEKLNVVEKVSIICADAMQPVVSCDGGFDIVLLDPPFRQDCLANVSEWLNSDWLSDAALIYVETEVEAEVELPWQVLKQKKTGQISYSLCRISNG